LVEWKKIREEEESMLS